MRHWIAEQDVVFVPEDDSLPRTPGKIAIAIPIAREADCACDVMIGPLAVHTIYGATTMQALVLAVRFVAMRLRHYVDSGGRLVYPPDGFTAADVDLPLGEIFGSLFAASPEETQDQTDPAPDST